MFSELFRGPGTVLGATAGTYCHPRDSYCHLGWGASEWAARRTADSHGYGSHSFKVVLSCLLSGLFEVKMELNFCLRSGRFNEWGRAILQSQIQKLRSGKGMQWAFSSYSTESAELDTSKGTIAGTMMSATGLVSVNGQNTFTPFDVPIQYFSV